MSISHLSPLTPRVRPRPTFLGQLLLHRPLGLHHVFVFGHVQFEDPQAAGALLGQALGPGPLREEAAGEHHEAPLVQAAGQLEAEAAVAARDEHGQATAILQGGVVTAGQRLGEDEEQQDEDGEAADGLADEEGGAHGVCGAWAAASAAI